MKTRSPRSTPIVLAFATLMSLAATSPAWAQEDYGVGRQSMRDAIKLPEVIVEPALHVDDAE